MMSLSAALQSELEVLRGLAAEGDALARWLSGGATVKSDEPRTPPFALIGRQRWPLLGIYYRLKAIITDPTGMVVDYQRAYGDLFTVRIPFNFDLTYVLSRDGYRFVMDLPADTAPMGPVMSNVPTVGFWYGREATDADTLQALLLAGRAFIQDHLLVPQRLRGLPEQVRRTTARHMDAFGEEVDLSRALVDLLFDASGRGVLGDALWDRIGPTVTPLYRDIVNGIDIVHTTLAVTPLKYLLPEYRSTLKLRKILDAVVAEHRRASLDPVLDAMAAIQIDGRPLSDKDLSWMLMYTIWNALIYPGTYGFWATVDTLSDPAMQSALRSAGPERRQRLLTTGLLETMRLNPVASLVRAPPRAVRYEHQGELFTIPPRGYFGVFPYQLCHDAQTYTDADVYDPFRYQRGEPIPPVFGRGAFGCVAQRFVKLVLVGVQEALYDRYDVEIVDAIPSRISRVHLTYPSKPLRARLRPASPRSATPDEATLSSDEAVQAVFEPREGAMGPAMPVGSVAACPVTGKTYRRERCPVTGVERWSEAG